MLEISEREGVVALHLPTGPLKARDTNPVPTSPLADGIATAPSGPAACILQVYISYTYLCLTLSNHSYFCVGVSLNIGLQVHACIHTRTHAHTYLHAHVVTPKQQSTRKINIKYVFILVMNNAFVYNSRYIERKIIIRLIQFHFR